MSDQQAVLPRLRDDLAAIDRDPEARRLIVGWGHTDPALVGIDGAMSVVTRCRDRTSSEANAVLGALLFRAGEPGVGAPLARRMILATLAPGLQHAAASLSRAWGADPDEIDQTIVVAALERMVALAGTAPRWPAHDVVAFARHAVRSQLRRDARRRNRAAVMDQPPEFASTTNHDREGARDAAELLRTAVCQRVISLDAAKLIFTTRVLGATPAEVASATGRSPAAIRRARERGERALRLAG